MEDDPLASAPATNGSSSSRSRGKKHVEFRDGSESASATEDEDNVKDGDWEDVPLPNVRARAKLFPSVQNDRTPTAPRRFFSPKKLRPRTSKMTIPSVMSKLIPKKASQKEELIEAEQDELMDEDDEEEEEDQLQDEEVQDEEPSQSHSEEEDEDDDFGSQAEESPAPEATPRPARTTRNGSKGGLKTSTKNGRARRIREPTPEEDAADEASEEEEEEEGLVVAEELVEEDEDEDEAIREPRVLRNGKVVGSVDGEDEEDEDEVLTSDDAPVEEDGDESESIGDSADEEVLEHEEVEDDGMEEGAL